MHCGPLQIRKYFVCVILYVTLTVSQVQAQNSEVADAGEPSSVTAITNETGE
jgi:hypothetical protein